MKSKTTSDGAPKKVPHQAGKVISLSGEAGAKLTRKRSNMRATDILAGILYETGAGDSSFELFQSEGTCIIGSDAVYTILTNALMCNCFHLFYV